MKKVRLYILTIAFLVFLGYSIGFVYSEDSPVREKYDFDEDTTEWFVQEMDVPTGTQYLITDYHGGWWVDAEKIPGSDGGGNDPPVVPEEEDDLLCWAATASNMVDYAGWGFVGGMVNADEYLDHFEDHVTDWGSLTEYGLEYWFDGTLTSHGAEWSTIDVAGGGDFWDSSGTYSLAPNHELTWDETQTLAKLDDWLRLGYPCGLGIYPLTPPGGHAITCWGFNYDEDDPDYYVGVWITDSDSHKHLADADDYLRYFEVEYNDGVGRWEMPNYGGGWRIASVNALHPYPTTRPTAVSNGPYTAYEGSPTTFDASGSSDPDPGTTLQYHWNIEDAWTAWSASPSATYTWDDEDDLNFDEVYVEVHDGHLKDTAATTVTVLNVAPSITATGGTISENGVFTLTGTIDDPGIKDTFTMTVDWGDGSSTDTYNYPALTSSFSETHQYLDDDPSGTASDGYTVSITMTDDDGASDSTSVTVTVNNVDPVITVTGDTVDEDGVATVSGTITDPGSLDTFTVVIDWGEGSPQTYSYPAGSTTFSETHQYLDDDPTGTASDIYIVTVTVTDDDTGYDTQSTTVTVNNVDPVVDSVEMEQPNDEFILPIVHTLDFTGDFTDVGTLDTHTAVWDWGDTTSTPGTVVESSGSGAVTGQHVFMSPGVYTVTLTVTDDDTGFHSNTYNVVVVTWEEAKHITNEYIQDLPEEVFKPKADKRKAALDNMFNALDDMYANEDYNGLINALMNNIRSKCDGTQGGKPNDDWIKDEETQEHLCLKIDDLVAYIENFL
jgi:hypothetical protein